MFYPIHIEHYLSATLSWRNLVIVINVKWAKNVLIVAINAIYHPDNVLAANYITPA